MNRNTDLAKPSSTTFFLISGLWVLMLLGVSISVFLGLKGLTWSRLQEIASMDETDLLAYKVWFVRLPRAVLALIIGGGLAVAGCLLQGITRNPLSDPEVMGINQSASFFVVLSLVLLGQKDVSSTILLSAFIGAAIGGSFVYILSLRGQYTSSRLALAGIAVAFLMGSLTTGFLILDDENLSEILYWMAGKLSGATWADVLIALLFIVPATVIGLLMARQFNILTLGEATASSLGQQVRKIRGLAFILSVVLVGSAVALAGPIGFVGLMVPHMARKLVGTDYRKIIPISALIGADLLLLADLGGQWVFYPADIPVGIITALLGTPFFLYVMRQKSGGRS